MNLRRARTSRRVWEIDLLRGLPIIGLLFYHLGYDIMMLPDIFSNYAAVGNVPVRQFVAAVTRIMNNSFIDIVLVPLFAGTFLLVTGISSSFSHNNIVRGLKLTAFSYLVTAFTAAVSAITGYELLIVHGILHCMGLTVLAYGLVELILKKLKVKAPTWLPFLLGLAVIFIGIIFRQNLDIDYPPFKLENIFKIVFGTVGSATDWFPVFPWSGVILCGISLGRWFYPTPVTLFPGRGTKVARPFCFLGRHTLLIYVFHQVVYILAIAAVFLPLGYRL